MAERGAPQKGDAGGGWNRGVDANAQGGITRKPPGIGPVLACGSGDGGGYFLPDPIPKSQPGRLRKLV